MVIGEHEVIGGETRTLIGFLNYGEPVYTTTTTCFCGKDGFVYTDSKSYCTLHLYGEFGREVSLTTGQKDLDNPDRPYVDGNTEVVVTRPDLTTLPPAEVPKFLSELQRGVMHFSPRYRGSWFR